MVEYISERKNKVEYRSGGILKGIVDLSKDYYKILGLEKGKTYKPRDITKARNKASLKKHSDKGGSNEEATDISLAFELFSDTTKYDFELTNSKVDTNTQTHKSKDITYKGFKGTPREFYDMQRARDFKDSATEDMFKAIKTYKTLTLTGLQDFVRDGADIDRPDNLKKAITLAFDNINIELLAELTKKSNEDLTTMKNSQQKSLLTFAIEKESKELVENLLKKTEKNFLNTNNVGKSAISFVFNKIGNIVDPTSKKNNVEILIMLIKNGANLDIINTKGDTLLTFAVERENKELVELLLTKGINIHAVNSQRKSAIELAFQQKKYKDHENVLIALIKSGAKVDIINTKGDTLLIFAADRGFQDLALLLIEGNNNDVNAVNAREKAAIDFALQSENIKIIEALVNAGANINVVDQDKNTLLMIAAKTGTKAQNLITQLIQKGIDVNASNDNGKTAIDFAIESGNAKIISTLQKAIKSLKDKNKPGNEGTKGSNKPGNEGTKGSNKPGTEGTKGSNKPGNEGTKGSNKPGTEGAKGSENKQYSDIETRDEHGNTPLMNAAKNGLDSLVKTLISKKANIKAINSQGKTAAHLARENEKYEALKILVENGSDHEMKDSNGNTLLMYAAKRGIEDIVAVAIKKGANVKAINLEGKTAAHFARGNEQYKALKILVENGSDPEMKDSNGNTLLMYAAKRGLDSLIILAIKKGAKIDATNNEGKGALWFAQTYQKATETEKALIASGANTKDADKYTKYMLEFSNNKIKFVLDYHHNAKSAKDAIHNLKDSGLHNQKYYSLKQTEDCLNKLNHDLHYEDLNSMCGESSNYHHTDF